MPGLIASRNLYSLMFMKHYETSIKTDIMKRKYTCIHRKSLDITNEKPRYPSSKSDPFVWRR